MFLTSNDIRILLQTQKATFQTYQHCIHTNFVTKFTVRPNHQCTKKLLFESFFIINDLFLKKKDLLTSKSTRKFFLLCNFYVERSLVICPGKWASKSRRCLFWPPFPSCQAEHTACSVRISKRKRQMSSRLFGTFLSISVYRAHVGEFGLAVLSVP